MSEKEIKDILIKHNYELNKFINKGSFSMIFLIKSNYYLTNFVVKIIIEYEQEKNSKTFYRELESLKCLNHPNIIRIYDYFNYKNKYFLILEECLHDDLFNYIKLNDFNKNEIIYLFYQIVLALDHCHNKNIAHLDIKPQNILISKYNKIKLSDFGLSFKCNQDELLNHFVGSFIYEAPEIILKKNYNPFKADIWSLGVTFFYMLFKKLPWQNENKDLIKQQILSGLFQIPLINNINISNLIKDLLSLNPLLRPNTKDILSNEIFLNLKENLKIKKK